MDRVVIWRAAKANPELSGRMLAELLGKPETTVRRALKLAQYQPKELLQAIESEAVNAWKDAIPIAARKGDHRPAKDLLLHTRAIEPVDSAARTALTLVIAGVSMPGLSHGEGDKSSEILNVIEVSGTDVTHA